MYKPIVSNLTLDFTYQFDTDDVPILGVIFEMGVPHKLVILQDRNPVLFVFHVVSGIGTRRNELLDCDGVGVEVLESEV